MAYSKFNIVYRLQKWMDSVAGQTFLNYAYSWGASIVILGTLFKLTHMPSANFWLFLGMGTEVFVFFISAFDRPFDKTADGMELSHDTAPTPAPTPQNYQVMSQEMSERLQRAEVLIGQVGNESQEIANLKETLAALRKTYDLHLKSAAANLSNIDEIGKQISILSLRMHELNAVYGRIIEALKIKE